MALDWYVGKTQRRKESAFQIALGGHGIEVFNPEIIVVKRGRKQWEPLFPTYLFCRVDPESDLWPQIRWARGLSYFLGSEGTPAPVASPLVEEIRERVELWNRGGWESAYEPGDWVRVGDGALTGLDAVFSRYLPCRQRCEVLVSLLGRMHTVQLPTTSIEALKPVALLGR
ncbi:MAG: transcription termination/antitermination NusG family protein [Dehalococcoidia bacterium]|nr:transcription termination/antitermination NusG family protein [Dehalococcoidia bacterium]